MAEVREGDSHHYQGAGFSIPVEYVQALAEVSEGLYGVPEKYIRPEVQSEPIASLEEEEIPIISLEWLLDPRFSKDELAKLHFACEHWGFFQLINHGVPEDLIKQMKDDMIDFFKLPLEEKKAYAQLPNNDLQGYGQAFVVSEDQKLDWGDTFYVATQPVPVRNMRFWPTNPPTFRDTLDKYSSELKKVAGTLLNLMAGNLGLDPEILSGIFKDQPQGLRMNYYPACPIAEKVLGISPHTDATGLTLLLQVSDVQGLQIRKDGKWFPVKPLGGAFVVNIADILEILSNGKYRSSEHRVLVNTEKERLSVAAFHGPDGGCMVGPLPELIKEGKANFRTTSYAEYMKTFFSAKLDGRSLLESMRLE